MVTYDAVYFFSMEDDDSSQEKRSIAINLVDKVGLRFGRLLSGVYSSRRRVQLEKKLKRAGYPAGLTQKKFIQRETGFILFGLFVFLFCLFIEE